MLLVVDATQKIEEAFIKDICSKAGAPIYLVLNKIDQVTPKEKLFTVIEAIPGCTTFRRSSDLCPKRQQY